ncbi:hypothetical protein A3F66_04120 [candidate division TM6 bacterium RIFCSPHIGHO2_12_FULL_32_22]|nr:MAG: hypothetical protein A3F66_04120 [candidate division TM6 bacterium RIFCSPHIGHO2_12_FULL_32_22]
MNYKFLSLLFLVVSLKAYRSELVEKFIKFYSEPKFSEEFRREIERINEAERGRKAAFMNLEMPSSGEVELSEDKFLKKLMMLFKHDRVLRDAAELAVRNKTHKKIEEILNKKNINVD